MSVKITNEFFMVNQHGKLEIVPPNQYKKLSSKGQLLSFDELNLPQRQEAKKLGEHMQAFMAKIDEIQSIAAARKK